MQPLAVLVKSACSRRGATIAPSAPAAANATKSMPHPVGPGAARHRHPQAATTDRGLTLFRLGERPASRWRAADAARNLALMARVWAGIKGAALVPASRCKFSRQAEKFTRCRQRIARAPHRPQATSVAEQSSATTPLDFVRSNGVVLAPKIVAETKPLRRKVAKALPPVAPRGAKRLAGEGGRVRSHGAASVRACLVGSHARAACNATAQPGHRCQRQADQCQAARLGDVGRPGGVHAAVGVLLGD